MSYRIKRADGAYWGKAPGGVVGYGFCNGNPVQFTTKDAAQHAAKRGKLLAKGMTLEIEEVPDGHI
jgi:hypothetical protein